MLFVILLGPLIPAYLSSLIPLFLALPCTKCSVTKCLKFWPLAAQKVHILCIYHIIFLILLNKIISKTWMFSFYLPGTLYATTSNRKKNPWMLSACCHLQKQKANPEQEEASQIPYNQVMRQYPQTRPLVDKTGEKKQQLSKEVLAGVSINFSLDVCICFKYQIS